MQSWKSCCILLLSSSLAFPASVVVPGIGNFHQVNDHIYRGAQPSADGFRNLAKVGVQIVVDLREAGERAREEEKLVTAQGMTYVGVPMNGLHAPPAASVLKVLDLLEGSAAPVFVHCMHGADRTGNVIACYRIEHDHWNNQKALEEARSLGMSRFEKGMQQYILHYQPRSLLSSSDALQPPLLIPALQNPGVQTGGSGTP